MNNVYILLFGNFHANIFIICGISKSGRHDSKLLTTKIYVVINKLSFLVVFYPVECDSHRRLSWRDTRSTCWWRRTAGTGTDWPLRPCTRKRTGTGNTPPRWTSIPAKVRLALHWELHTWKSLLAFSTRSHSINEYLMHLCPSYQSSNVPSQVLSSR